MAAIKAIEARSVHQIQSGQVIVDLCSVVKELVENSLDAHATSVDIRLKNNGLDLIEVQDNGDGISPNSYENIALKHHTSKLSTFGDLTSLQTFGFRGEALSSLCALSNFHIITAQADQVPKASRLDFEVSGKLKGTKVVAGQKGTTASVENLFNRLPVRRRELEKNIKREYGKVLALLHAYACISTGVRFNVKNQMPKGKSVLVFSTKSNGTTRENISNVYGAKTLLALTALDLELEFDPRGAARKVAGQKDDCANKIFVHGHISKPIFGEGRQTPDRQMFFVNSRPCGLPQIAKAFNEVYKSFNISQSPFIFANFEMDTSSYDVNVSPDKRTVLLHDAGAMIESLKASLTELFESLDQTVPQSQVSGARQTSMRQAFDRHVGTSSTAESSRPEETGEPLTTSRDLGEPETQASDNMDVTQNSQQSMQNLLQKFNEPDSSRTTTGISKRVSGTSTRHENMQPSSTPESPTTEDNAPPVNNEPSTLDKSSHLSSAPSQTPIPTLHGEAAPQTPSVVQNAFDHMRPKRTPPEVATITIGGRTTTSTIGGSGVKRNLDSAGLRPTVSRPKRRIHTPSAKNRLSQSIKSFAAPGTQVEEPNGGTEDEDVEEEPQTYESDVEPEEENAEAQTEESDVEPQEGLSGECSDRDVQSEPEPMDADDESGSDGTYIDNEEKTSNDEARVGELIRAAEEAAVPSEHNVARANKIFKMSGGKDSTVELMSSIDGSIARIESQMESLQKVLHGFKENGHSQADGCENNSTLEQDSAEEKLSLTVSKDDFAKMRIIGQFNLGFILATRSPTGKDDTPASKDELFIIDQHASDEKFNFERLQAETVVQNQRLVQPKTLDLTAVEEEVIIDNLAALEKNGFMVEVDTSGDEPIGRRCKLLSLPLSKEVVFNTRDLEELIVLLSEAPHRSATSSGFSDNRYVPRPSKVRKMFAMRACRSSIMVGKSLKMKQMDRVVKHMGMIDKPWNCPHGRPTMRHLMSLGQWREWEEWEEDSDDKWREFLDKYGNLGEG